MICHRNEYDKDSNHSMIKDQQAKWEKKVDDGY